MKIIPRIKVLQKKKNYFIEDQNLEEKDMKNTFKKFDIIIKNR